MTISGHKNGFDTTAVFDRIGNTHIAELESGVGFLDIHFSCRCKLTAFRQGDQMIVLDISKSRGDLSPFDSANIEVLSKPTALPTSHFGTHAISNPAIQPDQLSENQSPTPRLQPSVSRKHTLLDQPANDVASDASATSHAQAQRKISEHVGAAASRGLLRPKASPINLPLIQNRPQIDTQIFDSSTIGPTQSGVSGTVVRENLKITSSSDIPSENDLSSASTTLGIPCVADENTAVGDWASDHPFSTQIAQRRSELFSEFDNLNQTAALGLARTYLYFGFGLEVREVLELDPQLTHNSPALLEMAEIMEYGYTKQPKYLHNFMECDSDVALWAVLSEHSIDPNQSINKNAAIRAVTALPLHLRVFIAPELSQRLLNNGDPDAAAAALRTLERASEPLPRNADLAKADLEMVQGNVAEAQDRLAQIVSSNVEQSAEALIKFVDSNLDADTHIEQSVATLVEAYALQMRDEPIGAELRRTYVLALGKSGQFDAAFDALKRMRDRGDNKTDGAVTSSIFEILARDGSDIQFLDHVFQLMSVSLATVDPETNLIIAERLLELGFAHEAERVLEFQNVDPKSENGKIIRAKIALLLSRPFEAQATIFGLVTTEAEALRAESKAKSGNFDEAFNLYSRLGEDNKSQQVAWLSNDWATLIEQDTPVFGDVVRVAQAQVSEESDLDGMLSRTIAAIEESAEARSVIRDLLRASKTESLSEQETGKAE